MSISRNAKIRVMKLFRILIVITLFFINTSTTLAQDVTDKFYRARVIEIVNTGRQNTDSGTFVFQEVKIKIIEGDKRETEMIIDHGKDTILTDHELVNVGETVIVSEIAGPTGSIFHIADKYRLNSIWPFILAFFAFVVLLSRWKGVGAITGMLISLGVILFYIVPQIMAGQNPLTITIAGSLAIMISTIYLAHGFSAKTSIAVLSTFITLVGIGIISTLIVKLGFLTGLGSEDASILRFGATSMVDFRGLLLGGIIIGSLGVLDDITTGLTASIFEIKKANPKISSSKLFAAGLTIGKEHVTSLVNTLILAYAGTALPIFMIIHLNINNYPWWLILNDELIVEEIVRTLSGSIGIIAAVPLTTFITTFYLNKPKRT